MSLDILLIRDTAIKERSALHTNIDAKLIYPDIKIAQDMYLQPILGSALLLKLQNLIASNDIILTANADYKTLLDGYITDTLVYYTLARLPQTLSYQLFNKGVLRKNDDNSTQPTMGELIDVANEYRNTAEFYGRRLIAYLRAHIMLFPEYYTVNIALDAIQPIQDNYSTGIWLDDEENYYNKSRCNGLPYWPYKP